MSFYGVAPEIVEGEPQETGIEYDTTLPGWLAETKRHSNCPNHDVPLVNLALKTGGSKIMIFRGIVTKAPDPPPKGCAMDVAKVGSVVVSLPKEFGYNPSLHVFSQRRITPVVL